MSKTQYPSSVIQQTNWSFSNYGYITDLQTQNNNCGYGKAITGFQLTSSGNNIRTNLWCLQNHPAIPTNAQTYNYFTNHKYYQGNGGSVDKLENVYANCPGGMALQQFKFGLRSTQFVWEYRCVKANTSNCTTQHTNWTYGNNKYQIYDLTAQKVSVTYPTSQVISGFGLNSQYSGNAKKYRYQYIVCNLKNPVQPAYTPQKPVQPVYVPPKPVANTSTIAKTTAYASLSVNAGDGNVFYLSKTSPSCGYNQALVFANVYRYGNNISWSYNCLKHPSIKSGEQTYYTNWSSRFGTRGSTDRLANHHMKCPYGYAISLFHLETNNQNMRYQVRCQKVEVTSCKDIYTPWQYLNDFKTFNLSALKIQVNNQKSEVMQEIRLDITGANNGGGNFSYYIKVCTLKTATAAYQPAYTPQKPVQPAYVPPKPVVKPYVPYVPSKPAPQQPTNNVIKIHGGSTPWVHAGTGHVSNLSMMTIECKPNRALNFIHLYKSTNGQSIAYSKNCLQHPSIKSKITDHYTNWGPRYAIGGATNLLKNHYIRCPFGTALAFLKLDINSFNQMSYHYKCVKIVVESCYNAYTNWRSSGNHNAFLTFALEYHTIKTTDAFSEVIQEIGLNTSTIGHGIDYSYRIRICKLKNPISGQKPNNLPNIPNEQPKPTIQPVETKPTTPVIPPTDNNTRPSIPTTPIYVNIPNSPTTPESDSHVPKYIAFDHKDDTERNRDAKRRRRRF